MYVRYWRRGLVSLFRSLHVSFHLEGEVIGSHGFFKGKYRAHDGNESDWKKESIQRPLSMNDMTVEFNDQLFTIEEREE